MNLSKYEVLLKTVELGSLTNAAIHYGYTQSAVSQVIQSLEDELGVIFLLRSRAGLSLTTEGEALLPYIREIVHSQQLLAERINELQGLHRGILRIGAFHSLAAHILPPLIKGFQKDYPQIEFELLEGDFTELEHQLMTGRIDLAFLAIQNITNFETITLKEDPLYVVLPPGHPLSDVNYFPLDALSGEPFIYLDEGNNNDSQVIWKAIDAKPNVKYCSKEDNTVLSLVENGLGIAILPESALSRSPYQVIVKKTQPLYHRSIGIALKDKKHTTRAVTEFIKYVRNVYVPGFSGP